MFSKKKEAKGQPRSGNLAQYGLFDIPDNLDDLKIPENDESDEDLEAELAALTSGGNANRKPKRKVQKVDPNELNTMISESLKDVDEDVSDGEDDPELLEELNMITGDEPALSDEEVNKSEDSPANENDSSVTDTVKILQERLILYQKAERKAKEQNEAGKARRYGRGVKTLQHLLKDAQAGNTVNKDDIPPPLPASATSEPTEQPTESVPTEVPEVPEVTEVPEAPEAPEANRLPSPEQEPAPEVAPAAPADSAIQVDQEALALLKQRQQEYKIAALTWKKAGNMQEAMQHVKTAKQFDIVIAAVNRGEAIDLSDMPPAPSGPSVAAVPPASPPSSEKEEAETQQHAEPDVATSSEVAEKRYGLEDVGSALKERLEVYKRTKAAAEGEGNSSKARRYGRICKQFEDAIKLHARGKPVPLDELPTPPGYPPLSVPTQSDVPTSSGVKEEEKPEPKTSPSEDKTAGTSGATAPTPPPRRNAGNKNPKQTSRAEKQMMQLQERQRELKQAALNAKKDGDLELARDYLRQAKGMDPLIEASKSGLPVDMDSIPLSPNSKINTQDLIELAENNFELVSNEDCTEENGGTDEYIYNNLSKQLIKQIEWCRTTRDHCKENGDAAGFNKWSRLANSYTLDLDMLRVRKRDGLPPPLHHYETKTYAIVQSCVDLNDRDVEISIIRGVNYAREGDTYVIFEFPYPSDNPSTDKTSTVRDTCNPEYDAVFLLTGILDRKSRQCQRAFKRHALKCQVWAKGCSLNPILCCTHPRGVFRRDTLLGTVTVKLQPLEMQCILHDSFPLMEKRKPTGGKLELKIRLRNPILTKQIENITDRWLIIDN